MKKQMISMVVAVLAMAGINEAAYAGETSLAAYATYWDGGENGGFEGTGGGVKLRKKFLGFFSADVRGSYVDFSDLNTSVIPVEATLMVGIPFVVEPYAGLGAGYYFVDSNNPLLENGSGIYGVLGGQLNLWVVGAFGEIRYTEAEINLMDGLSVNLGLMVKW